MATWIANKRVAVETSGEYPGYNPLPFGPFYFGSHSDLVVTCERVDASTVIDTYKAKGQVLYKLQFEGSFRSSTSGTVHSVTSLGGTVRLRVTGIDNERTSRAKGDLPVVVAACDGLQSLPRWRAGWREGAVANWRRSEGPEAQAPR